jgi:hypothetical protein
MSRLTLSILLCAACSAGGDTAQEVVGTPTDPSQDTDVVEDTDTSTGDTDTTDTGTPCEDTGPEEDIATCSDGIDNDCNGVLDCDEPVCRQLFPIQIDDMLTVTDGASVDGLHCLEEITGDLYASLSSLDVLDLPRLRRVGGNAYFHQTQLTTLSLPLLERVEGDLYLYQARVLTTFELGSVTDIGGYLYLDDVGAVGGLGLASLTTIGRYIYLAENEQLQTLDLTALTTVNGSGDPSSNYVYMGANPLISECETDILLAQLQANGFSGSFDVLGAIPCP